RLRQDTDPTAIVRTPAGPPPAIRNGQVGGRAMLDPNEPLSGQLARLRGARPVPAPLDDAPRRPMQYPGEPRRDGARRRRAPSAAPQLAGRVAARARPISHDARTSQPRSRLVVAAGLVALLAIVGIAAWSGLFSSGSAAPPPPPASAGPSALNTP